MKEVGVRGLTRLTRRLRPNLILPHKPPWRGAQMPGELDEPCLGELDGEGRRGIGNGVGI